MEHIFLEAISGQKKAKNAIGNSQRGYTKSTQW